MGLNFRTRWALAVTCDGRDVDVIAEVELRPMGMAIRGGCGRISSFFPDLREGFDDLGLRERAGVGDVEGVADGGGFIDYFETDLDQILNVDP